MKNKEKFIDKLADFACIRDNIAINIKGEIVGCYNSRCEDCKFYTETNCRTASREWLEEEYIEPPLSISRKAMRLLEYIKDDYKYIARNKDEELFLYANKPKKSFDIWYSEGADGSIKPFNVDFPMVKWEDKEPWLIEDLKHLQIVDKY